MGFFSRMKRQATESKVINMLFVFLRVANVHALFLPKELLIVLVPACTVCD